MPVFRSIVLSAVVAGLVVGAIVTVVQHFGTVPLILKAEIYERSAKTVSEHIAVAGQHAVHQHDEAAWEPKDGLERNLYTAAADILTAIGFAMLLAGFY